MVSFLSDIAHKLMSIHIAHLELLILFYGFGSCDF